MKTIKVDGVKYLVRGDWTLKELKSQYQSLLKKYPNTKLSFTAWLVSYGKVYFSYPKKDEKEI